MLVLSRRPTEKILFPNLDISVEIIQTKGNTVRVGIEAPAEIRVLRGELPDHQPPEPQYPVSLASNEDVSQLELHERRKLVQQIDDIALAVALAQNQQRQGLTDNVDIALDQAIERLHSLKEMLQPEDSLASETTAVCESSATYRQHRTSSSVATLQMGQLDLQPSATSFRFTFDLALAD